MSIYNQKFGIEIELTGLTREKAADVIARYFMTNAIHYGSAYDAYTIRDTQNRMWKIVRDASITCQYRGQLVSKEYSVELVSPICSYEDIPTIQEIVRKLRENGAVANSSCGIHIHINGAPFDANSLRNITNIMHSKETLLYKTLQVNVSRERSYCKKTDEEFLEALSRKKPKSIAEIQKLWYNGNDGSGEHYHSSRYHWRIAIASLLCVPIGALIYAIMMRSYNNQYDKYMKASANVNSVIVEYIEGIQVIKAFNSSSDSYRKYTDAVIKFRDFTLDWFKSTWGLMNLGNAVLPSTLLGVIPMGVYLYLNGSLTSAELTLAVILSLCMVAPASWFTVAVNDYKSIQYAIADVNKILDMPELSENTERVGINDYGIKIDNICFSYDNDTDALHNLSLDIKQGSYIALVGPSGGGKSTLAKLIARFWDVKSGGVFIGGENIKNIPFSQLSDMVSFVTQDNFLFDCSLLENIRMGNPKASDKEVMKAAASAQCEEFISRLENGWNTTAGEAGGKLSGGERQRIAIARAILKNAPIVILDEATAFTDPENEAQLQRSISVLTKGKTLLVIAHRLSTIKNADKIVVLDNGEIRAQGTQNELLDSCELYRNMWEMHIGAKNWSATSGKEEAANV